MRGPYSIKKTGDPSLLLRRARLASGFTQEELADIVGSKAATISRYESGAREPTLEMLYKLAAALSVPPADLLQNADGLSDEERDLLSYMEAHPRERAAIMATYRSLRDSGSERANFEHED